MKIAYITTYNPRECGIATFCESIIRDVPELHKGMEHDHMVIAMNDQGEHYQYPDSVKYTIREEVLDDYLKAAGFINENADIVILQHEFNIFGGEDGVYILPLMNKLTVPSIAVFHTVYKKPSVSQKLILQELSKMVQKVVVISQTASDFCRSVYEIPLAKLQVIRHGVPEIKLGTDEAKNKIGLPEKKIIMTFGLLTRNKGLETVIRAMPEIVKKHPDVVYLCLGKTHPTVKKVSGEEYREFLESLVKELHVEDTVIFKNKFLSDEDLEVYLAAADFLITPYQHEEQISSGPLTFAMGSETAILSTPFWYAEEMLKDDRGLLFGFKDHEKLAVEVNMLLDDSNKLKKYKSNSHKFGKAITWKNIATEYLELAEQIVQGGAAQNDAEIVRKSYHIPDIDITHLRRLTTDTGIISHARFGFPDYASGYSLADNAMAMFAVAICQDEIKAETNDLLTVYLSFIRFMQNKDGSFRNHLGYDHSFGHDQSSQLAMGKTICSLGYLIANSPAYIYLEAAKDIFEQSIGIFDKFDDPRAISAAITGIYHFLSIHRTDQHVLELISDLTSKLIEKYEEFSEGEWKWFEPELNGEYGLIPQALLCASEITGRIDAREIAIGSVKFLTGLTLSEGHLSLIGTDERYSKNGKRAYFAQLPIDAMHMVLMYKKAYEVSGNRIFYENMLTSFNWFLGENDLRFSVYDPESKGCCDGLEEKGINRNQGAQSTAAFLIARCATQQVKKHFENEKSNMQLKISDS
ncbi:MAG: glycosyltransferase [Bacteroidales bacterium]|nr:glycosyltransferase [Bacteroidales bacterium]